MATPSSEHSDLQLNLSRRGVIDRTAIVYGQTPLEIQRMILLQMANEIGVNPLDFCSDILNLSEYDIFNIIQTYYSKDKPIFLRFFDNFLNYQHDSEISFSSTKKTEKVKANSASDKYIDTKISQSSLAVPTASKYLKKNKYCHKIGSRKKRLKTDVTSISYQQNVEPSSLIRDPVVDNQKSNCKTLAQNSRILSNTADDSNKRNRTSQNTSHTCLYSTEVIPSETCSNKIIKITEDSDSNSIFAKLLFDDSDSVLRSILKKNINSLSTVKYNKDTNQDFSAVQLSSQTNPILESLLFE